MLLGSLGASLLGSLLTVKVQVRAQLEYVKVQLEQASIFNATLSFNAFQNLKVSSK